MPKGRRARAEVFYNGKDMSEDVITDMLSLTVTMNSDSESADDVKLVIADREMKWCGSWYPKVKSKGDNGSEAAPGNVLKVILHAESWEKEDADDQINCGSFEIDEVSFSDPPPTITINATSVPLTKTVRSQPKTRAWEKDKLSTMARKIAEGAGMELMFDSENDPLLDRTDQRQTADLPFLRDKCHAEGLALKVTDGKLVIWNESEYEGKPSSMTFKRGDGRIISASFSQDTSDTAKSAKLKYKDPKSGKMVEGFFEPDDPPETEREVLMNDRPNDLSGDAMRETASEWGGD